MTAVIRVENLSKAYKLNHQGGSGRYQTLREGIAQWAKKPFQRSRQSGEAPLTEEFWALKDLDFEVQSGEVLAVIGPNGSGKSTLLKILSQITKPTTGRATLCGRVGSLLEVGTGFHHELTGRENIYLNGAILGMSRREITRKFDQIVEFAGVERFLDTPVKRYSSGMYVRLAFAVAAHLELEILLVDEVLAVGDHAFQQKCLGRMGDIARSGRTVLLVSHNLPMVSRLCSRGLWLNQGRLQAQGPSAEIIAAYCRHLATLVTEGQTVSLRDHSGRRAGSQALFERIALLDERGAPTTTVPIGGTLQVDLRLDSIPARSGTDLVLDLCDQFGTVIARANSRVQSFLDFGSGEYNRVRCRFRNLRLLPGSYLLNIALGDGTDYLDRVDGAIRFSVEPTDVYGTGHIPSSRHGLIALETDWELTADGSNGTARSSLHEATESAAP
jgi:lipopolysaccharide transport system ATP-binding protein